MAVCVSLPAAGCRAPPCQFGRGFPVAKCYFAFTTGGVVENLYIGTWHIAGWVNGSRTQLSDTLLGVTSCFAIGDGSLSVG